MSKKFHIFEISLEAPEEYEAMGTKEKFWFNHEQLGLCLYKKARQNTGEELCNMTARVSDDFILFKNEF